MSAQVSAQESARESAQESVQVWARESVQESVQVWVPALGSAPYRGHEAEAWVQGSELCREEARSVLAAAPASVSVSEWAA